MRALSDTNPAIPHFTFDMLSEDKMKHVHSRLIETIAHSVRWAVVGILSLVVALPVIVSLANSI